MFEVGGIDAIEPLDVGVALALEQRPIVTPQAQIKPIVVGIVCGVRQLRGIPHHFLGHAADVHAGAAEPVRFDHQRTRAVVRGALRAGQPAAAAADDYQVEIRRHIVCSSRRSPVWPDVPIQPGLWQSSRMPIASSPAPRAGQSAARRHPAAALRGYPAGTRRTGDPRNCSAKAASAWRPSPRCGRRALPPWSCRSRSCAIGWRESGHRSAILMR